jgi:hypothetical protein
VNLSGYICYRRDRQDGRRGGGVACYIRDNLPCMPLKHLEVADVESMWFLYRASKMPRLLSHIAVGVIYHPPKSESRPVIAHVLQCIDDLTRSHPNAGIILLGDFNHLNDTSIISFPLKQVVKSPTRRGKILDKIYTNAYTWYQQPAVLPPLGKSDHNTVVFQPSTDYDYRRIGGKIKISLVRSRDPNGKALLAQAFRNYNWKPLYEMNNCDEMVAFLNSVVYGLFNTYLPLRAAYRHATDKPWINDDFRALIKRRQHAWSSGNEAEFKLYRNKVQRAARYLRSKYYNYRVKALKYSDSHRWWREIKCMTGQGTNPCPLTTLANNECGGNMTSLAAKINLFFADVSKDLQPLSPVYNCIDSSENLSDYVIYPYEVERKLSRVNVHKSSGPDNIPNWILRDFSTWLAQPICAIFNQSIIDGTVPSAWKLAHVIPIPKTNPPRTIESDIRPISLTPTLSKILESFIGSWILQIIAPYIDCKQYGGVRGRSTTHELVDILHHWHQALDNSSSVRVVFLDYAKAFDHVDHCIVITKLQALGVPTVLTRWISSFLFDRHQRVKISDIFSDWITLSGGMPQGAWLGPLIFIILINDLSAECLMHKFLDDTTLSEVVPKGQPSAMQLYVARVAEWSLLNHMNINFNKTKEMVIGTLSNSPPPVISINNNTIQRVTNFKLLGVTL